MMKVPPIIITEKAGESMSFTSCYHYTGESQISQHSKWTIKKKRSLIYAASLERLGEYSRADRVRSCGTSLSFAPPAQGGGKMRLVGANFCRDRLCPMCTWRGSLETFRELSAVMDKAMETDALTPIFLTLTVKSAPATELKETIDLMYTAWDRLFSRKTFKRAYLGWFRALEITYNAKTGEYHPHFHAILLVRPDYFSGKDYRRTEQWVQEWRKAARLSYDPVCDIRAVKEKGTSRKAYVEVAKYTAKDSDYLKPDPATTDRIVKALIATLRGRRLYAYGGILKPIAKDYAAQIKAEKAKLRADVESVIINYRWIIGLGRYERME